MKKVLSFFVVLFFINISLQGAYLEKVPHVVQQPNGEELHCFVTGDEYYHWLHDADWFTIVQNPQTGYYVYATKENGKLVATNYVVGKVAPQSVGLMPRINITADEWREKRNKILQFTPIHNNNSRSEFNHGEINNLVVYIRFADQNDFQQTASTVNEMFNDSSSTSANSMYNYFKQVSYNQLFIKSHFYPEPNGDTILSYQDIYPRAYYEKLTENNLIGYNDTTMERTDREMALLKRAIEYIDGMVPAEMNLDYNEDGNVDNVCFIIKGQVGDWADLLWPHRWSLYTEEVLLNGKRVYDFNFQLSDNSWYFSNSVFCHEMFHSLGAPDLYHYNDTLGFTPVGSWDLMGSNGEIPQQMGAYMKYQYGNWIDDIPTITESGTYTVKKLSSNSSEGTCYKIPSEIPEEFFIVECRKKNSPFESSLPGSGLLIYRINTLFVGNADWNGEDLLDEVYLYRPQGTLTCDGDLNAATFRQGLHRTLFDVTSDPQPYLSNGYVSGIKIYDIFSYVDSVRFSYLKPGDSHIESNDNQKFVVFPNPTNDVVTIANPNEIPVQQIELMDTYGKILFRQSDASNSTISLNDYANGIYVVRIVTKNGESINLKVVKNR